MIQVSKNISIEGIDTKEELDKYLEKQEKEEPNSNVLKMFKWFLMKIERADKNKEPIWKDICGLDKYANKVIERKLMKEQDVINFICQAQGIEVYKEEQ